ncbi:MAG: lipopolysaccharide transport periplasmic protein LptA, partial [Burkholderiales bacterium]
MKPGRPSLMACFLFAGLAGALVVATPAMAQKPNSNEPVSIEADRMKADDQKQIAEFEGRVVLTQGSFQLRADKLTVRKDGSGFQHGTAVGQPATFRQKRDGTDEWITGEAARIEYDGRLD